MRMSVSLAARRIIYSGIAAAKIRPLLHFGTVGGAMTDRIQYHATVDVGNLIQTVIEVGNVPSLVCSSPIGPLIHNSAIGCRLVVNLHCEAATDIGNFPVAGLDVAAVVHESLQCRSKRRKRAATP